MSERNLSYDLQCLMLVEHFYPEWSADAQEGMAHMIQEMVEAYDDQAEFLAGYKAP